MVPRAVCVPGVGAINYQWKVKLCARILQRPDKGAVCMGVRLKGRVSTCVWAMNGLLEFNVPPTPKRIIWRRGPRSQEVGGGGGGYT